MVKFLQYIGYKGFEGVSLSISLSDYLLTFETLDKWIARPFLHNNN